MAAEHLEDVADHRSGRAGPWRLWRTIAPVAVAGLFAALAGAGEVPVFPLHPPIPVSWGPDGMNVAETAITASSEGHLVGLWMVTADHLSYAVSSDGGFSWSPAADVDQPVPAPVGSSGSQWDPYVVYYPPERWFVGGGLAVEPLTIGGAAFSVRTASDGLSFLGDTSQWVEDPPPGKESADFTRAACGPRPPGFGGGSAVYITNMDGLTPSGTYLLKSTDGGVTFSAWQTELVGDFPDPAVDSLGRLHVAYGDTVRPHHRIRYARSVDEGEQLADPGTPPGLQLVRNYNFDTGQWPDKDPYVAGAFPVPELQQMAADPTNPNKLYIVYDDQTGDVQGSPPDADIDVYVLRSTDGGVTWSDPIRIPDRPPGQAANVKNDQYIPAVTVDHLGTVHVVFYDTRRSLPALNSTAFNIDLFDAYSSDGGLTWGQVNLGVAVRYQDLLTPNLTFFGHYQAVTSFPTPDGAAVVMLFMGTASIVGHDPPDEAIFSRRIDFLSTGAANSPQGGGGDGP